MARHDYKHGSAPAPRPAPKPPRRSSLRPFLFGAIIGGLGAAGLIFRSIEPCDCPTRPVPSAAPECPADVAPAPAPKKPTERDYDYYYVLPEVELPVAEEDRRAHAPPPPKPGQPVTRYMLQVASFQNGADAERLRASLALQGIESRTVAATTEGKRTWHRVQVGPYTSKREMDRIKRRIQEAGFDAFVLRLK